MRRARVALASGLLVVMAIGWAAAPAITYAQVGGASYGQGPGASGPVPCESLPPSSGGPGLVQESPSSQGSQGAKGCGEVAGKALPKTGQGPADEQPSWAWLAALGTGAILAVALFTLRRLGGRRRVAPVATVAIGRLADQSGPRRGA